MAGDAFGRGGRRRITGGVPHPVGRGGLWRAAPVALLTVGSLGLGGLGAAGSLLAGNAPAGAVEAVLTTCTWAGTTGAGGDLWSVGDNWTGGEDCTGAGGPVSGSVIVFPADPAEPSVVYDLGTEEGGGGAVATTFDSITFEGSYTVSDADGPQSVVLNATEATPCGGSSTVALCATAGTSTVGIGIDLDDQLLDFDAEAGADLDVQGDVGTTEDGLVIGDDGDTGTVTLGGDDDYSGTTYIDGGVLDVTGVVGSSEVEVVSGILEGTGTVGRIDDDEDPGNAVAPGSVAPAPGTLTVDGYADLNDGDPASFDVDITSSGNSELVESNDGADINIDGAALSVTDSYDAPSGTVFTIIDGGYTGQFDGLAPGATVTAGGRTLQITYGDDEVTLTDVTVPTTCTWQGAAGDQGDLWSIGTNWTGGANCTGAGGPVAGSILVFPADAATTSVVYDSGTEDGGGGAVADTFDSLTFEAGYTVTEGVGAPAAMSFNATGVTPCSSTTGVDLCATAGTTTFAPGADLGSYPFFDADGGADLQVDGVLADTGEGDQGLAVNDDDQTGTVTLGGDDTYRGETYLDSGILDVTGSITGSQVEVDDDGTLEGDGLVGSIVNYGIVEPGTVAPSPGVLTVDGAAELAGDVDPPSFDVDITSGGNSELVEEGQDEQIDLDDSLLVVTDAYDAPPGTQFTIISGGYGGEFAGIANDSDITSIGGRTLQVTYEDDGDVVLTDVTPSSTPPTTTIVTVGSVPATPTCTATGGTDEVTVDWSEPTTGVAPTGYEVEAGTSAGSLSLLTTEGPQASSVTDTAVTPGTTYDFEVVAEGPSGDAVSGICSATPSAPPATSPSGPAPANSACAGTSGATGWICFVYLDLFDRAVDPAGAATWGQLLTGTGNRTLVAEGILTSPTHEWWRDLVTADYAAVLDRAPDPAGLATFVDELVAGTSNETVLAQLLASPEFLADAGGTDTGFVTLLYQDILGRSPDPAGLNAFVAALQGGASYQQVALDVLSSTEYRTDLLQSWYERFLGRPIDPSGLATFLGQMAAGASDTTVLAEILGSDEFYDATS